MNSFLQAKIKRHTGNKSCNFDTPEEDIPKFPILFASKRK